VQAEQLSSAVIDENIFRFPPLRRKKPVLVCVDSRKYNSKIAGLVESGAEYFRDHALRAKKSSIVLPMVRGCNHARMRDIRNSISFTIF